VRNHELSESLRLTSGSPAQARSIVVAFTNDWQLARDVAERAELLVSEIVADAVEFLTPGSARRRGPMHHLSEIASYAVMGRIRRLWVPEYGAIPASLDRSLGRAVEAWGDDDLIELLCAEVLRHQGGVEVLEGETFSTKAKGLEAELR